MIPIFIPTYGRAERQNTYYNFAPELRRRITLVVQKRESHLYEHHFNTQIYTLPSHIKTIAATRQHIVYDLPREFVQSNYLIMMDDDLRFCARRRDDPTKFVIADARSQLRMLEAIEHSLQRYAHVGILAREGGNRHPKDLECSRMMRVLAYDLRVVCKLRPNFLARGPQYTLEDFDVTLQLLRAGYKNLVLSGWVQDQSGSNTEGGCASYRTLELHNKNAALLARAHPQFVKLVTKTTKTAWGGGSRTDVVVQWKKAYESSRTI